MVREDINALQGRALTKLALTNYSANSSSAGNTKGGGIQNVPFQDQKGTFLVQL